MTGAAIVFLVWIGSNVMFFGWIAVRRKIWITAPESSVIGHPAAEDASP
jgi:hypothetical protein